MLLGSLKGPLECCLSWSSTPWFNIWKMEGNGMARKKILLQILGITALFIFIEVCGKRCSASYRSHQRTNMGWETNAGFHPTPSKELPVEDPVVAGFMPPREIVAIIRQTNFTSSKASAGLDQKYIVKDEFEMSLEINHQCGTMQIEQPKLVHAECVKPTSRNGFNGLYIFPVREKCSKLFFKPSYDLQS